MQIKPTTPYLLLGYSSMKRKNKEKDRERVILKQRNNSLDFSTHKNESVNVYYCSSIR